MTKLSYFALLLLLFLSAFSQTSLLTNLVNIPSIQDLAPTTPLIKNNTSVISATQILINPRIFQYTDPNCAKYDTANNCLQCSFRYYFNSNGICTMVNALCNTWSSSTGACTSCYTGYRLYGTTTCVLGVSNCASYSGIVCIGCDTGYSLNGGNCVKNVVIVPVVQYCSTYDNGGVNRVCTGCYAGYVLVSGNCFVQIPGCYQYNNLGQCTLCYSSYQLYQNYCYQYTTIANCVNASQSVINNVLTQVTCYQCASGYQLISNICQFIVSSDTQYLIQNVTSADNAIPDQYTLTLFNQLQSITPSSSVQCYNIAYVNWAYNPVNANCDVQTECSCNTKQVAIRTVGVYNKFVFYWTSEVSSPWFSWPSTNYYFYYTYPTLQSLNLFKATELCDGTWSFQNNYGYYLSGNRLYSSVLGCAQKWRVTASREGNGHFIQNVWNNGWLAFNGCRWQLSYYWRTKVRLQFWE